MTADGNLASELAAKAVTTAIPILFAVAEDPVRLGLVARLAPPQPDRKQVFQRRGDGKALELLRELVPGAARVAVLVNPTNPATETTLRGTELAARGAATPGPQRK